MLATLLIDLGILLGSTLLGVLILRVILPGSSRALSLSLAYPFGAGILSWAIFMMSLTGIKINVISTLFVFALTILIALILIRIRQPLDTENPLSLPAKPGRPDATTYALTALILLIIIVSFVYSIGRSYSMWDATTGWALQGYGIVYEGNVADTADWAKWDLAYPLNIPIQIGLFKLFEGDLIPGSKAIFPIYFSTLLISLFLYWRRNRVDRYLALLGVLVFATNPLVFLHSTIGLVNLVFSFYIVMAALCIVEGIHDSRPNVQLLGGILLALAAWTRAEGIGYCLFFLFTLGVSNWFLELGEIKWTSLIIPLLITFVPWFVFSRTGIAESHLGEAVGGMLPKFLSGQFNLNYLKVIVSLWAKRSLSPDNMGLFVPVTAILLFLSTSVFLNRDNRQLHMLLFITIVFALIPVGLFYVRSYTRVGQDFIDLQIRAFGRASLPAITMLTALSVLAFNQVKQELIDSSFTSNKGET
jgi:hypothetical protein